MVLTLTLLDNNVSTVRQSAFLSDQNSVLKPFLITCCFPKSIKLAVHTCI